MTIDDLITQNLFLLHRHQPEAANVLLAHLQAQRTHGIVSAYKAVLSTEGRLQLFHIQTEPADCLNSGIYLQESLLQIHDSGQCGSKTLVVWSCGLGEVINELAPYLTKTKLIVVEPEPELLFFLLQQQNCQNWLMNPNIMIFAGPDAGKEAAQLLCRHPSLAKKELRFLTGRLLADEENALFEGFQKNIQDYLTNVKQPSFFEGTVLPGSITFLSTAAHKELFPVLEKEAELVHRQAFSAVRVPQITRFLDSEEMLGETLGGNIPAIALTFSHQALLPREWKKLKEKGVFRVIWCYDDPGRNVASADFFWNYDHIFCFDPIHTERIAAQNAANVSYLPAATTFPEGVPGTKAATIPDFLPISFVGSTGLQRMDGAVLNQIAARSGIFKTLFHLVKAHIDQGQQISYNELLPLCSLFPDKAMNEQIVLLEDIITFIQRTYTLSAVCGLPFAIYGDEGWNDPKFAGQLKRNFAGKSLDYLLETPWVYHNTRININLFNVQCLNSPTVRMLDVMACGGFLLTEYRPFIETWFEIGSELDVFHSREELREKVEYYLSQPQKCREIALAGQEKIKNNHLYRHRLPLIFSAASQSH